MAVVPICYKMPYKDRPLPTVPAIREHERNLGCAGCRWFFSVSSDRQKRWQFLYTTPEFSVKTKTIIGGGVLCSSNYSGSKDKQLRLLDSYFQKLQGDLEHLPSSDSSEVITEFPDRIDQVNAKEELESLNAYLVKLYRDDQGTRSPVPNPFSAGMDPTRGIEGNTETLTILRKKDAASGSGKPQELQQDDETSNLYLINVLASINIAVFLFEIASPIKNSAFELFSLPLLYGAKINDLILVGEWWRLVTPMFLHSGAFHIALGCWSLITFGPQVCRGYGSFTFLLIYLLGGFSGNLTSFLHTPEPTVGGTGPIFSIIGAWLIYQVQNKSVISKDVSESLFQKAIFTTAACFILSHFGPIDDWTHLGAAITGIVFGFFTCPTLQLGDASSRTGQDEGLALIRRYADPCKSLVLFAISIAFLSSLLFLIEPPLETLAPDEWEQWLKK